jgi:peroxiredoxin
MSCYQRRNVPIPQTPAVVDATVTTMPPGLGVPAPEFTAMTTDGVISLSDYRGRWVILFSHPGDFTPVPERLTRYSTIFQSNLA